LPRILPGMTAKFFVGEGPPVAEPDVVQVAAPDTYIKLAWKTREAFRYALDFSDWDYVFKCDDDTYVVPERIESLVGEIQPGRQAQWIGSDVLKKDGYTAGGAGYLLARSIVQALQVAEMPRYDWEGEDMWCGCTARNHVRCLWTPRLCQCSEPYPAQDNDQVTCHGCDPKLMALRHIQFLTA